MNKKLSTIAIVQARMGSKRLPGKVLMRIKGRRVIDHLLDALLTVLPKNKIWIATSSEPNSDPLASYLMENNWNVHRGNEENVAARFMGIIQQSDCTHFIRISGDSPLFDPAILKEMIYTPELNHFDLLTTVSSKPYPSGFNAELLNADTFSNNYPHFDSPHHFEHVTRYFYEKQSAFRVLEFPCRVENARQHKFTLDTPEDKKVIETLFENIDRDHFTFSLEEKCQLYRKFILQQT